MFKLKSVSESSGPLKTQVDSMEEKERNLNLLLIGPFVICLSSSCPPNRKGLVDFFLAQMKSGIKIFHIFSPHFKKLLGLVSGSPGADLIRRHGPAFHEGQKRWWGEKL